MIDIESMVFDRFYTEMSTLHPEANITGGYIETDAKRPSVVVRETNNIPYRNSATDDNAENHTRVTYEVEVESDKQFEGRSECRQLLKDADDVMQGMKFRRIHMNQPALIDRARWRQYARYEVIVGQPVTYDAGTAQERTVYQMYRR